jgi:hypothetical protein
VQKTVERRDGYVDFLLTIAHADARQQLQLDHVDTRQQIGQVPAPALLDDALAFLLNDGGVPFGHLAQQILETQQILGQLVVGDAQLVGFLENRLDAFHQMWRQDGHETRGPFVAGRIQIRSDKIVHVCRQINK